MATKTHPFTFPYVFGEESQATFSDSLLAQVKVTLRESSQDFDNEILSYIESCAEDLQVAGVLSSYFVVSGENWKCNPQILQAVRYYCLSKYGLYNQDMEKYDAAYKSLKATICTQRKYTEESHAV